MQVINIAKDFSIAPSGRYKTDGENTGEHFQDYLLRAMQDNDDVTINFDGVLTAGSSFLEETFGGLVRRGKLNKKIFVSKIKIVSTENPSIIKKINKYIEDAEKNN